MNKETAQLALNFLLSDRLEIKGNEVLALVQVVQQLQAVVNGESTGNQEGGHPEAPPSEG